MKAQLITLILIASLVSLTACQQGTEESPPADQKAPEQTEETSPSGESMEEGSPSGEPTEEGTTEDSAEE